MTGSQLKVLSIMSMCLTVVVLALLIATWVNLHNDISGLETRIYDLEDRQKYLEYRLLETEKSTCGHPDVEAD